MLLALFSSLPTSAHLTFVRPFATTRSSSTSANVAIDAAGVFRAFTMVWKLMSMIAPASWASATARTNEA